MAPPWKRNYRTDNDCLWKGRFYISVDRSPFDYFTTKNKIEKGIWNAGWWTLVWWQRDNSFLVANVVSFDPSSISIHDFLFKFKKRNILISIVCRVFLLLAWPYTVLFYKSKFRSKIGGGIFVATNTSHFVNHHDKIWITVKKIASIISNNRHQITISKLSIVTNVLNDNKILIMVFLFWAKCSHVTTQLFRNRPLAHYQYTHQITISNW